tara:strand:+ start:654 stop:2009 length:1356 start_codon:yes stop_codon:yes gene_type:complete
MNILRKIFSPSCLTISLFLLFYTFYKSEIYWNGTKSNYYFIYYIVLIVLVIFSIITFYLNNKTKDYLIISLLSIISGLYVFESYLTFTKELGKEKLQKELLEKEQIYEKKTGNKYDKRTKYEIYKDLKKIDKNIKLSVSPITFINEQHKLYPLSGISNSKTIHCNENGYYSIYESDRYGFNNPDKEWDQNEIEYLLVGDSFAHGACVNRPHDIASVLRILSKKSVLNLGFSSNGPLIEYATLREYLNSNVKKVLWIYYNNDIQNLENELILNMELKNYLKDLTFTQNLKLSQKEIDNMGNTIIEKHLNWKKYKKEQPIIYFIKLNKIRSIFNRYLPKTYQPHPQLQSQPQTQLEFKKILKMARDLTSKKNSQLYFIHIPGYSRYTKEYNDSNYLAVKKIVNELNIPFIDIHSEVFEKEQNPLELYPFKLFGHYNVEGYRKVAEAIYKFTKN